LWKADPYLRITHCDTVSTPISTSPETIPTLKTEFDLYFMLIEEKVPNEPLCAYLNFMIEASASVSNIKHRNHTFLQYLKDNRIIFTTNKLTADHHASVGYLFDIHPKCAWKQDIHDDLTAAMATIPPETITELLSTTDSMAIDD
jgi:hypothetical protein